MYRYQQIRTVHLEVTSKCNASCPMCLRNVLGGQVNPHLPLTELSLDDITQIFTPEFLSQLERLYMCGNYGDPIMARDTAAIFRHFRLLNSRLDLQMFTNGSGRDENFWRGLAADRVEVRFSVDGLEDTNHIYRRGTKWPLILRAMRAFLGAGGVAEWDFIVFRHNEHQIEEARALSRELGFKKFNVKKTARFFSNVQVAVKDRQEVRDRDGNVEYYLEQPSNPKFLNSALKKEDEIVARFGSLKEFFAKTPIDCKAARESSLYITAEGFAFPCCWTANQLYPWYYPKEGTPIWKMLKALPAGVQTLNAKTRALADIVNGGFFQSDLPRSWDVEGFENGRLFVCGKTCGKGFDSFKAQFEPQAAAAQTVTP